MKATTWEDLEKMAREFGCPRAEETKLANLLLRVYQTGCREERARIAQRLATGNAE